MSANHSLKTPSKWSTKAGNTRRPSASSGFSAVEVIIAIFVVAAIGVTGYLAYSRMKEASQTPSATEQADKATTPSAPTINGNDDLDAAAQALDNTNLDASLTDTTQLDSQASTF